MKKLKIYLDTSVISYLFNDENLEKTQDTHKLWAQIKAGKYEAYISEVVMVEVGNSPEEINTKQLRYLKEIEHTVIVVDEKTNAIADKFIELGILKQKSYDDCQHIACAIVSGCDIIVSWNFKHIVNHKTIRGAKAITNLVGYDDIMIYSPTVLIGGEDNDS